MSEDALCCCSAPACVQAQSASVPGRPERARSLQQQHKQQQSRQSKQHAARHALRQKLQRRQQQSQQSKHQQHPPSRLTNQTHNGAQQSAGLTATQEPPPSAHCMGRHIQPHSRVSHGAQTRKFGPLNVPQAVVKLHMQHPSSATVQLLELNPAAYLHYRNELAQCWEVHYAGTVSTDAGEARSTGSMRQEVRPAHALACTQSHGSKCMLVHFVFVSNSSSSTSLKNNVRHWQSADHLCQH